MLSLRLAALLLLLSAASAARPVEGDALLAATSVDQPASTAGPEPPRFPGSYTVRYTFSLPYTAKVQPQGIRYPVEFYRDAKAGVYRMDTYNQTTVMIVDKGTTYELVPRIDRQVCLVFKDGDEPRSAASSVFAGQGEEGPIALGKDDGLMTAVPDVSGWQFAGEAALEGTGQASHVWEYTARHAAKQVDYKLWVAADGSNTPLRLHMQGTEIFSGSHFDEWVVDYTEFIPGRPDPALFKKPSLCKDVQAQALPPGRRTASQLRMAAIVPAVAYRGEHAEYDAFLATHGAARRHRSLAEYRARAAVFSANHAMIEAHNAGNHSYRMAMNRLGDYTREEFVKLMLPKLARRLRQPASAADSGAPGRAALEESDRMEHKMGRHELPYEPLVNPATVPVEISWRGTGADGFGPMDQASCGSCWAFSAAGAMEGAWFRATGQQVSFSEQQIVDCSWGFIPDDPWSNAGCDGGNHYAAIGHIVDAGGIALTADYQYKGQDGYCQANKTTLVGKFKGYARVPKYDDAALREAVYSRGPVAISFDASQPSFTFYSSGVYREERCAYKPAGLDHDILLVGYGTSPEGDYWEVKNSWSDHWGDGGYFKVAVDDNACGVPADAVYAVVA